MKNTISQKIKSVLKKVNVSNKVSTYGKTITVKFLSPVSKEIVAMIKEMETIESHGDIMDDTRYYTGLSIQFDFAWEATKEEQEKAVEIFNSWSDESKEDKRNFLGHFQRHLEKELGFIGLVLAPKIVFPEWFKK